MNQKNKQKLYDLIIVGAGPAAFSAAIYAARKKLTSIVITDNIGGQLLLTGKIGNYLGIQSSSGMKLSSSMQKHVKNYGVSIVEEQKVRKIKQKKNEFEVFTSESSYSGKSILIASGKTPRQLNVPGEKKFEKKGVSYCSTCDAIYYKNKDVVVIGGGNAGLDAALDLTKYANKIYILEFTDKLLGDELTQEKLNKSGKITFIMNAATQKIKGGKTVEELVYKDRKTGKIHSLKVGGVFIVIGAIPSTKFVKKLLKLNDKEEIVINLETNATNVPGIFAAGDVTNIPFKQCIIAAGEGAKAALNIYDYLQKGNKH